MIENNLEGFHDRVNGAYQACRQAVNAQLRQQQEAGNAGAPAESRKPPQESPPRAIPDRGGSVTTNQLKAIYAITKRLRLIPLQLVHQRFDRYVPEDLTIHEASQILDERKPNCHPAEQ